MKMHKRLLNSQIIERLGHKRIKHPLAKSRIFQRRAAQTFFADADGSYPPKFNAFLFQTLHSFQLNKFYNYSNVQFEFGLPLFFLKIIRIKSETPGLNIHSLHNSIISQHIFNQVNNLHENIRIAPLCNLSVFKSDKSVYSFNKNEFHSDAQKARKEYSVYWQNVFSQIVKPYDSRPNISEQPGNELSVLKNFSHTVFDRLSVNRLFNHINEQKSYIEIKSFISKDIPIKFLQENKIKSLNPIELVNKAEIIVRTRAKLTENIFKTLPKDESRDKQRDILNKKTTEASDFLPKTLLLPEKTGGPQKHYPSSSSIFPVPALEHKQIQSMKAGARNFINGDDLPELIHKKTRESVMDSRDEHQPAIPDQHMPVTMMKPQGIIEPVEEIKGIDVEKLADNVMNLIEQRLRTEQERRGIFI